MDYCRRPIIFGRRDGQPYYTRRRRSWWATLVAWFAIG